MTEDYMQDSFNNNCRECDRLAGFLDEVAINFPEYYAKPVPPFGDPSAQLLIVGLAPGLHGANATGRPFTGDYAGLLLYETLHKFGFSNFSKSESITDGLLLKNCRITNAVKCLPPQNKPNGSEVKNCQTFLKEEIAQLSGKGVIIALGTIAHKSIISTLALKQKDFPFQHGAEHLLPNKKFLLDSYHCSRYNTQTKRLTKKMFYSIFEKARVILNG